MRGRFGMAVAAAAMSAAMAPSGARGYELCVFMTTHYDTTVFVGHAWWDRPRPNQTYENCVHSTASGAVEVSFRGQPTRWSCGITVPEGNQAPVKLVVERVNPGIAGYQPFLDCRRKTW